MMWIIALLYITTSAFDVSALSVPASHYIENVGETSITVSWEPPMGRYDMVMLICTNQEGGQSSVCVRKGRSVATCRMLKPGTEYLITLATKMQGMEPMAKPVDVVSTKGGGWMKMLSDHKFKIIGGIVGAVVAPYAVPGLLAAGGFGAAGIAAGSWAAYLMSLTASLGGGGIAAGSLVAVLQSIGAAGMGLFSQAAIAAVSAAVGAGVGAKFKNNEGSESYYFDC